MRDICREYLSTRSEALSIPLRVRQPTREMAEKCFAAERDTFEEATRKGNVPECFGKAWAGFTGAHCRRCRVQVRCLHRQTFTTGSDATSQRQDKLVQKQLYALLSDGSDSPVSKRTRRRDRKVAEPWGPPTFARRFLAERERNPLFAQLQTGAVLERTYRGRTYVITVGQGFYEFDKEYYPTLYAITKQITGLHEHRSRARHSRKSHLWSAKRFFFDAIHRAVSGGL